MNSGELKQFARVALSLSYTSAGVLFLHPGDAGLVLSWLPGGETDPIVLEPATVMDQGRWVRVQETRLEETTIVVYWGWDSVRRRDRYAWRLGPALRHVAFFALDGRPYCLRGCASCEVVHRRVAWETSRTAVALPPTESRPDLEAARRSLAALLSHAKRGVPSEWWDLRAGEGGDRRYRVKADQSGVIVWTEELLAFSAHSARMLATSYHPLPPLGTWQEVSVAELP